MPNATWHMPHAERLLDFRFAQAFPVASLALARLLLLRLCVSPFCELEIQEDYLK